MLLCWEAHPPGLHLVRMWVHHSSSWVKLCSLNILEAGIGCDSRKGGNSILQEPLKFSFYSGNAFSEVCRLPESSKYWAKPFGRMELRERQGESRWCWNCEWEQRAVYVTQRACKGGLNNEKIREVDKPAMKI